MTAEFSSSPSPATNKTPTVGLPPVQPPSGRHIVQMFLVPGLIVASIVGVLLVFTWLFGGPRSPEEWLKKLDDSNSEVRWRAASDLAQVLLRDRDLAANADFALQIAARLDKTLKESETREKEYADRLAKITDQNKRAEEWQRIRGEENWKRLDAERKYVIFLGACLGNFTVPVGVPLLKQLAEQESGVEPRGQMERRWRAVFALANLGQKLNKEYPALSDARKDAIEQQLEKAMERRDLAPWAGPALEHLKKRRAGRPDGMGLDVALERIADPKGSTPFLRELVALALNFWIGTDAENERMESVLVQLTHDTGAGGELQAEWSAEDPDASTFTPNTIILQVCYNANTALANRGSAKVRVEMLKDMLDEDYLRANFKSRKKDGIERTDEAAVIETLTNTLKAITALHRKNPTGVDLSSLRPAIDKLADNPNKAVQLEAKNLQKVLDGQ